MHPDPRGGQMVSQPQFPPPGFAAEQVPPHQAPEHYGQQLAQQAEELRNDGPANPDMNEAYDYEDYFGFDETHRYMLPDGRQYIEFKTLNEGDLGKYQQALNRDVLIEKGTGNARVKMNQVEERHAMLLTAVTGWHLMRRDRQGKWVEAKFSAGRDGEFHQWMKKAHPRLIQDLDEAVRKANPFLLAANTETLEAIDKQIADLQEQRERIVGEMQGKSDSATN